MRQRYLALLVGMTLTGANCAWAQPSEAIAKSESPAHKDDAKMGKFITNSVGIKLVHIPAGEFVMGSPIEEEERNENEAQHRVRITKPFYLGVFEVTQAQFEKVTNKTPSAFSAKNDAKNRVIGVDTTSFPVERITWDAAVAYCDTLTELDRKSGTLLEGHEYKLPTEAQWEYACRAGTETAFNIGKTLSEHNAHFDNHDRPQQVGRFKPNGFGLYDMHGNVAEWCADWYDKSYYVRSPIDDPTGPATGWNRVIRGGDWDKRAVLCRSAYHFGHNPMDLQNWCVGFRVALVPQGK